MFFLLVLSLSIIHVCLTAKGLLRNIQLLSGCRKSPVVFKAGLSFIYIQYVFFVFIPVALLFFSLLSNIVNCSFRLFLVIRLDACSVHSSESLEREKEALRAALQDATRRLQEEHQQEMADLEQKLQAVHKAEWDHVHLNYQEEANEYKTLMLQQMEELKANQEAMKLQLESSHAEQLQSVRQQYELSLEGERKAADPLGIFPTGFVRPQAQIEELTVENNVLLEKLAAEKSRRRELVENTQDSHTLYLEQELESLKVVLEIKNKQLHKQEKKLLDVGKLTDKKVQLDEMLIKVQQENEDLKARMERHAALSRQLSTEQALLQESLQKESKVNKRLSMENEELLWKLHNGDVGSPRKLSPSPTSPPHPFKLQSPRASGFFSSPPVSPR
uniref:Microtubule associated tumor suppressor 1a n=1 Tax=Xiphophorus couchianus TaxID=32473 RepID=A0A3B5LX94_9TELE